MENKPLKNLLALFLIFGCLIFLGGTLIWIFTGNSLFGWYPDGIIENIGNLILGIWGLIIGFKQFIYNPSHENQWLNNLFLLFIGLKIVADEIYHLFDGKLDRYINPISIFFGLIIIGLQTHILINRKRKNTKAVE